MAWIPQSLPNRGPTSASVVAYICYLSIVLGQNIQYCADSVQPVPLSGYVFHEEPWKTVVRQGGKKVGEVNWRFLYGGLTGEVELVLQTAASEPWATARGNLISGKSRLFDCNGVVLLQVGAMAWSADDLASGELYSAGGTIKGLVKKTSFHAMSASNMVIEDMFGKVCAQWVRSSETPLSTSVFLKVLHHNTQDSTLKDPRLLILLGSLRGDLSNQALIVPFALLAVAIALGSCCVSLVLWILSISSESQSHETDLNQASKLLTAQRFEIRRDKPLRSGSYWSAEDVGGEATVDGGGFFHEHHKDWKYWLQKLNPFYCDALGPANCNRDRPPPLDGDGIEVKPEEDGLSDADDLKSSSPFRAQLDSGIWFSWVRSLFGKPTGDDGTRVFLRRYQDEEYHAV